jgi:class 3 adenylate cyclase
MDVRQVLPTIRVPTLVLQRRDDVYRPAAVGRYLAEHIAGSRYVELEGVDHLPYVGDMESIALEIESFVTGTKAARGSDRVLATVLFTDIVGSTERAATLGDRAWADLLRRHNEIMRESIVRFRGREVDTAGDGFFATFDGPARAIRAALAAQAALAEIGVRIRAGVHAGEVELDQDQVRGLAVHIGARIGALAAADEVLVSGTVRDLSVGSDLVFTDRGTRTLKGVPGDWPIFSVAAS